MLLPKANPNKVSSAGPEPSFPRHQLLKRLAQNRCRLRSLAVLLTILRFGSSVTVRWLFVPLTLGNDVAQFVVRQTDHHAVRGTHLLVDCGLDRCIREVGAWIRWVLD